MKSTCAMVLSIYSDIDLMGTYELSSIYRATSSNSCRWYHRYTSSSFTVISDEKQKTNILKKKDINPNWDDDLINRFS